MGYVLALSDCYACRLPFWFHPDRVPSIRDDDGVRQPICEACMAIANVERAKAGRSPLPILDGAYGPADEDDDPLPWLRDEGDGLRIVDHD